LIDGIRDLVKRRIEPAGHDPDARLFTGVPEVPSRCADASAAVAG
jgi:hypothetical protein